MCGAGCNVQKMVCGSSIVRLFTAKMTAPEKGGPGFFFVPQSRLLFFSLPLRAFQTPETRLFHLEKFTINLYATMYNKSVYRCVCFEQSTWRCRRVSFQRDGFFGRVAQNGIHCQRWIVKNLDTTMSAPITAARTISSYCSLTTACLFCGAIFSENLSSTE